MKDCSYLGNFRYADITSVADTDHPGHTDSSLWGRFPTHQCHHFLTVSHLPSNLSSSASFCPLGVVLWTTPLLLTCFSPSLLVFCGFLHQKNNLFITIFVTNTPGCLDPSGGSGVAGAIKRSVVTHTSKGASLVAPGGFSGWFLRFRRVEMRNIELLSGW